MTDNITLPRATVQQVLGAIDLYQRNEHCEDELLIAGHFLRTALEQQQAEPVFENLEYVAVVYSPSNAMLKSPLPIGTHLYKYPPQRKELSAGEILNMMPSTIPAEYDGELMEFARAVEAKTKEGT